MYKKTLLTISLIAASCLQASVVNSLETSSCKNYTNVSEEQVKKSFINNIKEVKSNISDMNITPVCISLQEELNKVDNSTTKKKIKHLIESENILKEIGILNLDFKSVKKSIDKEYSKLNRDLREKKRINPKDKKTLDIDVEFFDKNIRVRKIERKAKGVSVSANEYTEKEFILKYPFIAKMNGIGIETNIKKKEKTVHIVNKEEKPIETTNIQKVNNSTNKEIEKKKVKKKLLKKEPPKYTIIGDNVVLFEEIGKYKDVSYKERVPKHQYVWGVWTKNYEKTITKGKYTKIGYDRGDWKKQDIRNGWVESIYLQDLSKNK